MLTNKTIVLGITGGIAAYKAADIASKLTQAGARIDVVMTESATKFIAPLTLRSLTGRPVVTSMWELSSEFSIEHVALAEAADVVAIAPGITTAADALFARASALPRVELVRPKQAIGTNTITAMQSGIVFGYVGLIEGIVARIQQELGEEAKVVATGGYAELIAKETAVIDEVNPDLTLIGLRLIYLMNKV